MTAPDDRFRMVLVTWWDAHGDGGWIRHDELPRDPCVCTSVGFVIPHKMPEHVTLVQTVQEDHNDNRIHIPFGMIRAMWRLVPGQILPVEPCE